MATRAILVRAVNVGGTARLPMAEFRTMLEELGAQRARTYIASGNAVVGLPNEWSEADTAAFDRSIERELDARFGFQRDVISRNIGDMVATLAEHPFEVDNPAWSFVTFLGTAPTAEHIAGAAELAVGNDQWSVLGGHLHVRYRKGMSTATLNADALMKRLNVVGTARNLRTVQAIIDLSQR